LVAGRRAPEYSRIRGANEGFAHFYARLEHIRDRALRAHAGKNFPRDFRLRARAALAPHTCTLRE
jgi:hypothetical protein